MSRLALLVLGSVCAVCNALLVTPVTPRAVATTAAPVMTPTLPRADISMMAAKKAVKKPVKKAVKKVVKKPVKKVVKKVAKKVVKKPIKRGTAASTTGAGRQFRQEAVKVTSFGLDSVFSFGGGNGATFQNPNTLIAIAAWFFVLFRFVLFYGSFGGD